MATLPYEFKYVRIPADESEPFEELTATATIYGDALTPLLKEVFKGGSIKNAEGLRAEYGSAVDEKMAQLNLAAAAGSVEIFALVRPAKSTQPVAHAGTYFYLDEMGVLKDLPVNRRASQVVSTCGLDAESPFLGDIYVGRVCVSQTPGTPTHSVDFELSELDSASVFLRSAPSENNMYSSAMHDYNKAAKEATQKATGRANSSVGGDSGGGGGGGGSGASSAAPAPAVPGTYTWAQTPEDLEVTVVLPASTVKKDLKVSLSTKGELRVVSKASGAPLLDLQLFGAMRPDEMTWTYSAGGAALPTLTVMAEKAEAVSWNRLEAASEGKIL